MKTMEETVTFKGATHEQRFMELLQEQRMARKTLYKREMAVIYTLSAMNFTRFKDFLHERGCFPQLDMAVEQFEAGNLEERDVALFALAMNLHNGQDVLADFGLEGSATPYQFLCLLKDDISIMGEAMKIYREGFPLS